MNDFKSYPFRHRLISFTRDINVRGIRRLSILLPKLIMPNPKKLSEYTLKTIHGFYLNINPAIDNGVELSLHQTGTYEKGILYYLSSVLKEGDCFIDVGANIGLISIYASKFVGDRGTVLAFEAHPKTANLLEGNIKMNKLTNIQVRKYALGSSEGKTFIYDNWQVNRGGASLVVKTADSEAYEIDVHCLDYSLQSNLIPKAIKIDVEGFEMEVLKGAVNTIRTFHPVLIIELSENRSNTYASSEELIDFVKSLGNYQIFKLKGGKERKSRLIKITDNDQLPNDDNVICIHQ